jgi:predicted RNA methylase
MPGYVKFDSFLIIHDKKSSDSVKAFLESGVPKYMTHTDGSYLTTIENSVHYNALKTNNYDLYEDFVKSVGQTERSAENFRNLYNTFDVLKLEKIVVHQLLMYNKFIVFAGNHRLSILKYTELFKEGIPIELLEVVTSSLLSEHIDSLLRKTRTNRLENGWDNRRTQYGYHSFRFFNLYFTAQRNPLQRLEKMKNHVSFFNKKVLDLGCNSGGMLLHLPEIKHGIGVDIDNNCLNAAREIADRFNYTAKYEFIQCDLNEFDITHFCKTTFQPDIVFLLSLGSWIRNIKTMIQEAYKNIDTIIFETNNDSEGAVQLELFADQGAKITLISDKSDDDYTGNDRRKTYLIEH